MNDWDNEDCGTKPGDTEPHGQKCLYKVKFHNFCILTYITILYRQFILKIGLFDRLKITLSFVKFPKIMS